ncbi:hypothetical protein [Myxococcus qinghaiensis]|uniref:hypothetical protein n=1 Tax=Myxococcus qinghaiensis TaxID=2906758 RepID=UPI0020A7C58D|nr:hypothetical protein [Myxococcus qinghaiensis]MCP3168665.1 hypothetical protein [Myxococcus qinghaiensis]
MNRIAPAVLSGLLALLAPVACTSPAKSTPAGSGTADTSSHANGAVTAKLSAPVEVGAKVAGDKATITLRFQGPASDVQVNLSGVDGLRVTSDSTPLRGARFEQPTTTTLDVDFAPGDGRSHLVVTVSGNFRGAPLTKVASFSVGEPSVEQQKTQGDVVTGDDGQPIKLMPSSDSAR